MAVAVVAVVVAVVVAASVEHFKHLCVLRAASVTAFCELQILSKKSVRVINYYFAVKIIT